MFSLLSFNLIGCIHTYVRLNLHLSDVNDDHVVEKYYDDDVQKILTA